MKKATVRQGAGTLAMLLICTIPMNAIAQSDAAKGDEISSLHDRIEANIVSLEKLKKSIGEAHGDVLTILERRLEAQKLRIVDDINSLSQKIIDAESAGKDRTDARKIASHYLQLMMPGLRQQIDRQHEKMISLISANPPENMRAAMSREIATNKTITTLVNWYATYYRSTGNLDAFDMDATGEREFLSTKLQHLAELLADSINLATEELDDTQYLLALTPDDKGLQVQSKLIQIRKDTAVSNLGAVANLLEELDIDSSGYKSLVLRSSGDVSTGILETGVWANLLKRWGENVWEWTSENSLQWIFKLLVLVIVLYAAWTLSRITRRVVEQATSKVNLSRLLKRMVVATAANGVFVIGILIALSQIGISIGPLLAGLGIAGIIIGFALQDTLSNFASGMMILIYRPYDVGDLIDAGGEFGTVTDMNLVSTVILTIDNQTLVVPNNLVWRGVIRNVTAQGTRRVDMTFGISYNDDIPKAERVLEDIVTAHEKVLAEPEPVIKLHSLGESSVDFVVRPWVRTQDYWDVYWDITREVKLRFDAEGISIPFPQRDVHLFSAEAGSADLERSPDRLSVPGVIRG